MNYEFNAIEVPGEANPLTEGILFHALRSASSSDPTQIQTGSKQLQQWEKTKGFYSLLQVRRLSLITKLPLIQSSVSFSTKASRWRCATWPSSSSRTVSTSTGARRPLAQ